MRVLHLETGRHLYGGARQVAYLLEGLREHDVDCVLVCPNGSAIASAVSPDQAKVITLPLGGDLDIGSIGRLRRVIRQESPDIVHLHSRRGADTFGALAALGTGARVVLSRRVDNPEKQALVRLKYGLYSHVITISRAIGDVLRGQGVDESKLTCVHSAVDPGPWEHSDPRAVLDEEFSLVSGAPVIGMAAQFIPRKGHDILLDALERVVETWPDLQVLLFGKGREQERIQRRVLTAGLSRNVVFAGFRDDLPRWFGSLELLVHPALAEGLGVALLQGAAAGVPMVASDAGGIGEIVLDQQTGRLVPPGDAAALADAMLELLGDRAKAARLASNAREHLATSFSVAAMARGNFAVYRKVLAGATP